MQKYGPGQSEFDAVGFTPAMERWNSAPFVRECKVKFAKTLQRSFQSNGTDLFVIGSIEHLIVEEVILEGRILVAGKSRYDLFAWIGWLLPSAEVSALCLRQAQQNRSGDRMNTAITGWEKYRFIEMVRKTARLQKPTRCNPACGNRK